MPSDILAVFDCVTLVQSAISQAGPAVRCLELFEQKKIKLAVSTETLAQIREVLSRPVLRKRFPELTEVKAQRLMVLLVNRGMLFRNVHRH